MASMLLEIVTPEGVTYSSQVDEVIMPSADGELGILPMHAPLMTKIVPGELLIRAEGKESYMAVGEGFAEVVQDRVAVLTDMAVEENDIDEDAVTKAMERAQKTLEEGDKLGAEEAAMVQAAIQKSMAQLRLKRRRRI